MSETPGFDGIKAAVEGNYPTPVAAVFHRCRVARREDLGGRHKNLVDLFEALVKFLCVVELQEARRCFANLKDLLPQKEKTLEFLKRPSLGGWVGLLRILCDLKPGPVPGRWMPRIAAWYGEAKNPANAAALARFEALGDVPFEKRTKTPVAELVNAMVTYRNKQLGHAANLRDEEIERRLPVLEQILAFLLSSASFLGEMSVFYADKIEVAEDNEQWKVHADLLVGTGKEPRELLLPARLERGEVYLAGPIGESRPEPPVSLSPFVLWKPNEDLKTWEAYVYNDCRRTHLEYLSYTSGTFYFHKELHGALEELIELHLKPGVAEEELHALSPEERASRAEGLFKQAMLLLEKGQLEAALAALESSVEFERRAGVFLEMAKIQEALGDPEAGVQMTLQGCLDLEPGNPAALAMRSRLEKPAAAGAPAADGATAADDAFPTVFHALAPARWREYALLWWLGWLAAWYTVSAGAEWLAGRGDILLPKLLQFASCACVVTAVVVLRSRILRQRLPLSLQLDTMRLERFNAWFDEQMRAMLGRFVLRDGSLRAAETARSEWGLHLAWAAFTVSVTAAAFVLSGSWRVTPAWWPVRVVDYALIYATVFAGLRLAVGSTLFVYRYSGLSLKPMLTRLNDDGMRSFGPVITLEIAFLSVLYVLYWALAAQVVHLQTHADFFLLGVASSFFLVWSIGMPLTIRRAAGESKSKAVHEYSVHLEKAFKEFLADPDDGKLQRYEWLVKNQRVIRRIATWPLSWPQTLVAVVFSNLLLVGVDAWYVAVRTGSWPRFVDWLRGVFGV